MTNRADYYESGDWNARCAMCGQKYKAGQLRKHWQGAYRCDTCWEPRHPQDFVRAGPPPSAPTFVQAPEPVMISVCTPNGISAIAGFGVAGCMVAGYTHPFFDLSVEF